MAEVWQLFRSADPCQLLPQREVFHHEVGSAPTDRAQRAGAELDEEDENTEH